MRLVTIVGARPQFIKAAPFSRAVRLRHTEILVHTGQHYDPLLSDVFFDELALPRPDYHLGVGSGSHARQTAQILERVEDVLLQERPDAVVVYGDTNSTLAGALAAAKLAIPIAHVEAGLRSFVRDMPEEINRVLVDRIATWLFAPTAAALEHLRREGVSCDAAADAPAPAGRLPGQRAWLTGDIMRDALLQHADLAAGRSRVLETLSLAPGAYCVATVHRAANTASLASLGEIFDALALLREPVIVPLHPRTRAALMGSDIEVEAPVRIIEPLGYLDMLQLQRNARMVLTDSGGMQKEAYLLGVPCVTLREETEWVETLDGGWNVLAGADAERILRAGRRPRPASPPRPLFGDGAAAERMVALLESALAS